MKQLDALFSKLISFCSDETAVANMQHRYQILSDLVFICKEFLGIDEIWRKSGFERGNPETFFADQFSWLESQRTKQELSMELRHCTSIQNLEVETLLGEWPGFSPEAKQRLRVDITNKLKESTEDLRRFFESMYKKNEHSPLYRDRLPEDTNSKQVMPAILSWAPVVFADDEKIQNDLFKRLELCYDGLQRNAQSSVEMCKLALGKYEFQHAEEHFKVVNDSQMIVAEHVEALKLMKDFNANVSKQKANIESVRKYFQDQVTALHSEFSLASKNVLEMYDCKSAVIEGPANISNQEGFDNLFVHVPIHVGIGVEITESKTNAWSRVQIAKVFDGSPAWQCGIRKHDVLLKVGNHSCSKQAKVPIETIRGAIMGVPGSFVDIQIQRDNRVFTVKRDIFGPHFPETEAMSSANPVPATSLLFRKFSSHNDLCILLENEEMQLVPDAKKGPCPTNSKQFCSLNFVELRNKTRGPVRVLDKLNVAQEHRNTGTAYDEIKHKLKLHLEEELCSFVELLLSKRVTSEDAEKWQNNDIFSEELLAHLPKTKDKMQQLKRKIEASSEIGLKASLQPSLSISDEVDALRSCHLIKTTNVTRSVKVIEDKICSYCKDMIESPELFQRFLTPDFRDEYSRWSLFWHFLFCLDPTQADFQPRSWQSWERLETSFRKSVSSRIRSRPDPRCCDAFSDAAFEHQSFNSKDVVDEVEASFMILREKPYWKTATLIEFFHDESFHDVLQKLVAELHHFFIEKKLEFDAALKMMSQIGGSVREKKADVAWMTKYYKIYKQQSATSDCLLKHSDDPSFGWIVDSNGRLREFGADIETCASSDPKHFPFVTTFVQLDQNLRAIFKDSLDIVLANFHESDDCRSSSHLNYEKVYKQLNDNYQVVKCFVKVFPEISSTTGSVLHDIQQHFQSVLGYYKNGQEEVHRILDQDDITDQFATQIQCYQRLTVYHNNVRIWNKSFEDDAVKDMLFLFLTKMNDDANKLVSKIGAGIQLKAVDAKFEEFCATSNVASVCGLFRALRCMASNLVMKINQKDVETFIDDWFKRILGSVSGSFRMKRICKQYFN
jgi:hypothetical protein